MYMTASLIFITPNITVIVVETLFMLAFSCVATFMAFRVERLFRVEFQHLETLRELSETDPLTSLLNRRGFEKCYELVIRNNSRYEQHAAFILIDVDFFKPFNDTYGHQAGDEALQAIAETLQTFARRPLDACARMGGEEFCLLLNDVNLELLEQLGQRICNSIEQLKIPHSASNVSEVVTISLGMTNISSEMDFSKIYRVADHALFTAKRNGRNQIVWVPSDTVRQQSQPSLVSD
jgi:diguanylate cyclase (GGDEF)-like protein